MVEGISNIDPWTVFPPRLPVAIDGVTFGGSDGRRAIMPGETEAREDWILCDGGSDGKGGTVPDLRGRMILGASDEHEAGSTGGSKTHTHSISGTVGETTLSEAQLAKHYHEQGTQVENYAGNPAWAKRGSTATRRTGWSASFRSDPGYPGSVSDTGSSEPHTHSLTGAKSGSASSLTGAKSGSASSLPPYYAGHYVIRV